MRDRTFDPGPSTFDSLMTLPLAWYLVLSATLFGMGVLGVLLKRNASVVFLSVELMLNAVNLTLVAFSQAYLNGRTGDGVGGRAVRRGGDAFSGLRGGERGELLRVDARR